jgi:calcium-dependent protein kinase
MAITFFHSNKIVHTDIKRENISFFYRDEKKEKKYIDDFLEKFFTDKEITEELINSSGLENLSETSSAVARELSNFDVKILDFGSAKKKINRSHLSGVTGTVYYCSPEIVNDKYDFECDEWACGVMMYILFVAEPPFQGESEEEIFSKILKDEPNLDVEALNDVSDNCKDLIKKLLEKDSKKRIKACDALKHPFFTNGINIGNLFKGKYKENNEILKSFYKRKTQEIQEKKGSKFRDMVMAYITLNFSEKEEEKKARKIFMEMSGGDNHFLIRKNTFVKRLNSIYKNESKEKIEELFDSIDEDKSGNIEYEELIRALTDKNKLLTDKNLKDAFGFFDKDKNGSISWNEIAEVIYPDGQIPKQIMKDFMKEIGEKDENKEITFEQFKKILTE